MTQVKVTLNRNKNFSLRKTCASCVGRSCVFFFAVGGGGVKGKCQVMAGLCLGQTGVEET